MKRLLFLLLSIAASSSTPAALAQASPPGAASLQTQPASIEQMRPAAQPLGNPANQSDATNGTGTLQANPPRPAGNSLIPEGLLPPATPRPIDPLEFFKVPPPSGSVKIRIGG